MTAALLTLVMLRPARIFEYPYFMGATVFGFVLPQGLSLLRFPGDASEGAITMVMIMGCLCLAACWLGYQLPVNKVITYHVSKPVNNQRLFDVGIVFILIAYYFEHKISMMTEEETGGTMWTGRVTIYGFFASLILPGFAIALRTALKEGTLVAWLATIAGAIKPILTARENTALFILIIALCFYFERRKTPPRLVIIGVLIAATIIIPATGIYRGAVAEEGLQAVTKIDYVQNFKDFLSDESVLELRNAAMIIDATRHDGNYEWGRAYWDQIIFRFVPAQLLGAEFKDRLMFVSIEDRLSGEIHNSNYVANRGSTFTGMGDSFQQFGWFGCLFFAFMAVIFKSLWLAAQQKQAVFAQLFYIQITTSGMRALTHQTLDFLPGMIYNGIFLGLAFIYAHDPARRQSAGKSRTRRGKRAKSETAQAVE
jgi:hypothetical protein